MNKEILSYFAGYVSREIGVLYQDDDLYQLEMRIANFIRLKKYGSPEELHAKFSSGRMGSREAQEFLELATNNETSFFRDPTLFNALRSDIFERVRAEFASAGRMRFWSAAASTGQEAYSVAMALEEWIENNGKVEFEILCTDFNQAVLARAEAGIYNAIEISRGLTPDQRARNFQTVAPSPGKAQGQEDWLVTARLRQRLSFRQANLLEPIAPCDPFHVVFLRNVLIYQSVQNRCAIVARIKDRLVTGGFLILGATENLIGIDDKGFAQVSYGGAVVYRKV